MTNLCPHCKIRPRAPGRTKPGPYCRECNQAYKRGEWGSYRVPRNDERNLKYHICSTQANLAFHQKMVRFLTARLVRLNKKLSWLESIRMDREQR
jgi:hypothetical protein